MALAYVLYGIGNREINEKAQCRHLVVSLTFDTQTGREYDYVKGKGSKALHSEVIPP